MGEEQILQLAQNALKTSSGKSLLGDSLNITDITNRIQELSSKYNIDLSSLENVSTEEINFTLGSNLTRDQRREKRRQNKLTSRQRLQEKLDQAKISGVSSEQKVKAEIALLKEKLKSQIPILQEYNITGRLQDKNTNTPLSGAKVTLGVNADVIKEQPPSNPLNVDSNLLPSSNPIDLNDLVFTPIPGQGTRTDKKGNFSIKVKVPIIPENQKTPINLGLLYSKSGYLPGTQIIINGDKTIKTDLSLTSLINLKESAEKISQQYSDAIDLAQSAVKALAMNLFDKIISAKKFSIAKVVDAIKTKLLPLVVGLLIQFGISKITQANRKTCPTPEALRDIVRTRNRTVRQLNQMFAMIAANTALAVAFAALSQVLKGIRLSMDAIPAPQAIGTPPAKDFGGLISALPYSFTAKLQHINDELEKLEEQYKGLNRATLTSLIFLIAGAATAVIILQAIDKMTQECAEESGVDDLELTAINQELLDLAEEQAEDGNPILKNVNGFILSVETDNKNPVGTLKRRFTVAKDTRGITLLKGEPSFSSSDQILIDELVFYIQQNDLKAN